MNTTMLTSTGDPITFEIEGIDQVQAELDTLSEDLRTRYSVQMMSNVGEAVKWWMQQNILAQGLLKTGALFNSVFATVLSNEEGATVYVGPNTEEIVYAMIQNYGGHIYPVNKKALSWIGDDGNRIFAKHVYIPDRPYIEPAFNDHEEEILEIMNQSLNEAIGEAMAVSGASTW